jgi:glycerol dehydrogenase
MNVMGAPQRYVQGIGALDQIGPIINDFGKRPFFVADTTVMKIVRPRLEKILQECGLQGFFEEFQGQCCRSEIARLTRKCRETDCDIAVGLGGGKTSDTTKALKLELKIPLIIAPTIASNDSPTSRIIVVYSEEGAFTEALFLPSNPEVVLVDTAIIAQAPLRFLMAGIGDALATKFEAEQCYRSGGLNFFKARPCQAALTMADTCYQIIRKNGILAKKAVEAGLVTEAVEQVVEANILLSGIGFESGGLAVAHALNQGFTLLEETHHTLHGENVAFGLLVQFILENRDREFMKEMVMFYKEMGLPCTLEGIGLKEVSQEKLHTIVKHACRKGSYIYNMAVPIDEKKVLDAILMADILGL